MAVPVGNIAIVVRRQSDNVQVAQGVTDANGSLPISLPPGKYVVESAALAGHTLDKTVVNDPIDGTVIVGSLIVNDVDVAEMQTTSVTVTFNEV